MPDWKESINDYLAGASGVGQGRKLVASAGTRVTLGSAPARSIVVQALETNTGHVVVGGASCVAATATREGTLLSASAPPVTFDVDNLNKLYVDSRVAAEGVAFTFLR